MKQFDNPELVKVGETLGNWLELKCPYCQTVNWVNMVGEVVDIVECHKCSKYFWALECDKSFFMDLVEDKNEEMTAVRGEKSIKKNL